MKKKILALFLSLVLVLTACPMGVFAADAEEGVDGARVTVYVTPDKTGDIEPGDLITYTIALGWTGSITAFQYDLILPDGLEFESGTGVLAVSTKDLLDLDGMSWDEECFDGGLRIIGFDASPFSLPEGYDMVDTVTFNAYVSDDATEENDFTVGAGFFAMADEDFEEITDIKVVNLAVPAIPHKCQAKYLDFIDAVDADCVTDGNIAYYDCRKCDLLYLDENAETPTTAENVVIPALGHTEVIDEAKEPDCENTGLTEGKHCETCGEVFVKQETLDALGHTEVIDEAKTPDCVNTGLTEGKHCSVCEKVLIPQETVDALGHTEVIDEAKTPDCENTGLTEGKHCETCGEVFVKQETLDALGHTEVIDEAKEPDCENTGLTEGKHCETCGEVFVKQETLDALGHTEVIDEAKEPDCENTGLTEGKHCETCGEVFVKQETLDALGHTEVIDEAKTPDCVNTGLTEGKHCSVCEKVLIPQETVDALGHTEVIDEAKAPTCTDTGLTEGKHCSVCGETLVAQETVDALGHQPLSEIEWEITEDTHSKTCGECGEILVSDEHNFQWKIDSESTSCVDGGTMHEECTVCGKTRNEGTEIEVLEHTIVFTEAKEPTHTEEGNTAYYICTVCDNVFTDEEATNEITLAETVIPASGHDDVSANPWETDADSHFKKCSCGEVIVTESHDVEIDAEISADCENTGLTEGKHCSVCEKVLIPQETVDALGHTEVVDEEVPADCENTGLTEGKHCETCGKVFTAQTETPALGHDYESVVTPPTAQAGGYTTYTCTRCGHSYKDNFTDSLTFTVSGIVTSFGSVTDEITIELVKVGETEASHTVVVTGKPAEYSFEGVEEGAYTLYVSKKNHATRTYDVTVTEENVALDLKIHLKGDITGEGIVNAIDVSFANGHSKGVRGLSGYELACADVTGEGNINAIDVSFINGHSKGVRTLWSE